MKTSSKANLPNTSHLKQWMGLDYTRFSSLLPYRYFDFEDELFINEQSLGFALELAPLTGANEAIIQAVADLIKNKLHEQVTMQVMLVGSNQVGEILDSRLKHTQAQGAFVAKLGAYEKSYLQYAAVNGFPNSAQLELPLRDYRVFCFVSKHTGYNKREVARLCDLRDELQVDLNNASIQNQRINLIDFLSVLTTLVNPNYGDVTQLNPPKKRYDKHKLLQNQIVEPNFQARVEPDSLKVELDEHTTQITSLSLKQLPEELALWAQADNFSNIFKPNQGIACPFVMTVHFQLQPEERTKLKAFKKASGYEKKANSPYAKLIPGTVQAAQDWKKIREELTSGEVKLCKVYFQCVLFTEPHRHKEQVSRAISAFRHNGMALYAIRYQQLQSFLSLLPFTLDEGLWADLNLLGRTNTLSSWNLANLLPLVADFKGLRTETGVFAPTFRHQAASIDLFAPQLDNYNACICATSGSGKSVLSQALITSVLADGGCAWVIDLGQSYKKFCETLGGVYLDASNLKLNPFSNINNIAEQGESIRDLLTVMAAPQTGLVDVQKAYLLEAIRSAYQKAGHQTTIDTVIEALESLSQKTNNAMDLRLSDLTVLLKKYSRQHNGSESLSVRLFNEPSRLNPTANLIVLELGELESQPDLLKAVLFALILHIENAMYQGDQARKKLCVIDEAWRLLSGSNQTAASFIEKGFRTARKHNGSFVTITQKINDFYASPEAQAAWSCAENKIIMRQNEKAFKDFLSEHPDYFDAFSQTLIKNFKPSASSGFSEFMIQQGAASSFHRLFLDPFRRVMMSSKASDHHAVQSLVQQGLSTEKAIMQVAEQCYGAEVSALRAFSALSKAGRPGND